MTEVAWSPQQGPQEAAIRASFVEELFYGGAAGGGKILQRGAPVLTPFGWRTCEELDVGSRISAPDGTTCRIIQLHPWQRITGVKVTFHDGTSTTVAWDHLWLAWRSGKRKKRPRGGSDFGSDAAEVVETRELAQWLKTAQDQQARGHRPNWPCIPVCEPQPFNVQSRHPILLDPYQLGLWLGDGHAGPSGVRLTSEDTEHILRHWPEMRDWDGYAFGLIGDDRKHWEVQLERAGLMGTKAHDKFVPHQYLWASPEDRLALLQGLMDTDGTADSRGQLYFTSISHRLMEGVVHLVQSLGGTATVTDRIPTCDGKGGQRAFTAYVKLPNDRDAFRLERKRSRCDDSGNLYRRVVAVEEVGEIEGRCITVSHPSGLYITNDFIVTHNSDFLLGDFLMDVDQGSSWQGVLFRQTFPALDDLVHRSHEFYPRTGAKWLEGKKEWRWPNGACLRLRHFESVFDFTKYIGHSFSWIGWDELPEWPDAACYQRMLSRLRGPAKRKRVRSTGNPGGVGHGWVQDYFTIPSHQTTYRDAKPLLDPKTAMRRMFIPSRVQDNKILLDSDPNYVNRLHGVGDDELVKAWLEGDWTALVGAFFAGAWSKVELADSFEIPDSWPLFSGLDYGEASPTAWVMGAMDYDKNLWLINEYYVGDRAASEHAEEIAAMMKDFPFTNRRPYMNLADPSMFTRRRLSKGSGVPAEARVQSASGIFREHGVYLKPGNNNRVNGWRILRDAMAKGKLKVWKEWCPNLIEQMPQLPRDKRRPEDVDTDSNDHLADALRYMGVHVFGPGYKKQQDETAEGANIISSLMTETKVGRYG